MGETKVKFNSGLAMPIVCYNVKTSGENIKILRIADHFAWTWDNKADGKSYGDYCIAQPYKDPRLERKQAKMIRDIDAMLAKAAKMADGEKKEAYAKEIEKAQQDCLDVGRFYKELKDKDEENLLAVLIEQADSTIEKVNGTKLKADN